jgi:predicted hydrocarbon binding protein
MSDSAAQIMDFELRIDSDTHLYTVGRNFGKIFATLGGEILEWLTSDSFRHSSPP